MSVQVWARNVHGLFGKHLQEDHGQRSEVRGLDGQTESTDLPVRGIPDQGAGSPEAVATAYRNTLCCRVRYCQSNEGSGQLPAI